MIAILLAASTVLVPPAPRLVPAVVLVQGSGVTDRDGTIGPNTPIADLARGLADRGIASIRFDAPGPAAEPAAAAIRELASARGVDPQRIFLLGHAEGAAIAPRLAERGSVRGLVLLAPAARPVDERMIEQARTGASLVGDPDAAELQASFLAEKFVTVKDPKSVTDPLILGRPAAYWRDLMSVDLVRKLPSTKVPVLVLQGENDFEVRKDLDFDVLRSSVGSAGGRIAYRSFPGLNHYFIAIDGASSGSEYGAPGSFDADAIGVIADWILSH
jgi:uncharacterized protein